MTDHWAMRRAERRAMAIEQGIVLGMAITLILSGIGFTLFVLAVLAGGR